MNLADLNRQAQLAIECVLKNGVTLESDVLVERIMALGYRYRPYVVGMVNRAYLGGMLEGIGTKPRQYRLAPSWVGDLSEPIEREMHQERLREYASRREQVRNERLRDSVPAIAYSGPVFDRHELVPSLGVICESQEERDSELPPSLGGRIVDSLHQRFDEIFRGVE
ncbi:hypothetical protein [Xanthomonas citri]|uniref:hypothetical protein n=1 Tax=Xanthomonas citri TaxID=346 RepID=UPI0001CECE34|nr:hypothetical protein [Xanthomonas citri]AMV00298.1 hypothetical protein TP37_21070 [Xanthomonas citri pv. aurantifolii]AMV04614.1 hypothetical protein TP50_20865 [Xanthomonas citri pv. aurantifolii]EFF46487.1 hypothetical protein XAUC_31350 [Xanthomonas citri pv. aurantifolii str. ICPB 10535]MCC8491349.1 hypothetical protein [Xanthomonas citri pv. fuscans]TBW97614.1 hypothetical protein TP47_10705 [Xanthomonas citri pv. aurantifolii]